ncbi:MAG: RHS repeat-associated core domain-containing protein [Lachnospiraceae bacterium]|nr:RHS repeat-associated core domain-containing protein [Lachnospiraceae bacterium]
MKKNNRLQMLAVLIVALLGMALTAPIAAKADEEYNAEKKEETTVSSGRIYYLKNSHGDVIGQMDENGNLLTCYAYNAFGEQISVVQRAQKAITNRFLYAGEQYDATSSLYYLRARHYDVRAGRFTQEDTYLGDGRNLYAYVHSNPLKYVDPTGHTTVAIKEEDGNPLNDWQDIAGGKVGEVETYYRTMSQSDYDYLRMTGEVRATGETFISPTQEYASNYDGTTVKFQVTSGTTNSLLQYGVGNNTTQSIKDYGVLPQVSSGWSENNVYFKGEGLQTNIGLGQGVGLETFNSSIVSYTIMK